MRGESINFSLFRSSFLNFTVKNYENWSIFAKVIVKIKVVYLKRTG